MIATQRILDRTWGVQLLILYWYENNTNPFPSVEYDLCTIREAKKLRSYLRSTTCRGGRFELRTIHDELIKTF